MSAGTVFQGALRAVVELDLPDATRRDVEKALSAANLPPVLQLLFEAGHEAQLPRDDLLRRAAGCFLSFAAGNLADDIIDGDCDYLSDPVRLGPSTQFLLQNLAFAQLAGSGATQGALSRGAQLLAAAVAEQHTEVRTDRWTFELFQRVGESIVGRQWAAYLVLLWGGTALEGSAVTLGGKMGIVGHVADDIRSADVRWTSMPAEHRDRCARWALAAADELERSDRRVAQFVVRASRPVLEGAL